MKAVCDALCVLACALGATTATLAEPPSPQPMPNGARVPPGAPASACECVDELHDRERAGR